MMRRERRAGPLPTCTATAQVQTYRKETMRCFRCARALSSRVVAACLAHRPNEPISHGHQGTRPFYGAPADRAVYWFAVAAWNAAACSAPRPGAAVADVR